MASKHRNHWRALVGALAVAGLAFGLSLRLEGAAHVPGGISGQTNQKVTISAEETKRAVRAAQAERQTSSGEPVVYGNLANLMAGDIPTFPVIVVDYRDDDATRMREAGLLTGPLPMTTHDGGVAGAGCSFNVDCDDGNRCTADTCIFPAGGAAGSGACSNVAGDGNIGNAQCAGNFGLACGGCDDGLFCNGVETCSGGACVAGTSPCTGLQVCSESFDMCQDNACTTGASCSNAATVGTAFADVAALKCNGTETCSVGVCIAGENPCGAGAICGEKQCSSGPAIDICLTDADCLTLGTCSLNGPVCMPGRCCVGSTEPTCTRRTKSGICSGATPGTNSGAACMVNSDCDSNSCPTAGGTGVNNSCNGVGGVFSGHDDGTIASGGGTACPIIDEGGGAQVQVKCPKYGSGIAPRGPFSALLGPISDSPVVVAPFGVPLQKLGDDYTLSNPGVCVGGTRAGLGCGVAGDCPGGTCNLAGPSFIALDFLRFAGGSPSTDRISFEFYDESGNFVEDLFFSGTAAFGVYPVLFDPPITIPAKGFVVQRVAPGFSPNARHVWASTNGVDAGTNDPAKMYVNGGPVASNFGTTGILSFELEGTKVAGNFGACCYTNPDTCSNAQLEWVCRGTNGNYLGNASICAACDAGANTGAYCRSCSNNLATVCNVDADCPGGTCIPDNGDCPGGACIAEPSCNEGGCCNPTTGACTVELESACIAPRTYLGNGSDCDSDNGYDDGQQHCCPQPVSSYSGGDNCENAVLHVITAPPVGETKVITITGNNTPATNTFANPDSCFDPSTDPNNDPGWWEGFTLTDACTIIYVDHCCTDPVHRPAYRVLYDTCPCGSAIFTTANPYAFPEPPDSRGRPYCAEDDNAWQCFGLLGPGTYYYPIYSALAGHHGDYQLHIVAKACARAACCTQDQCVDNGGNGLTQFECDAIGGFFLAPPNMSPAVSACTGTNGQPGSTCYNGSCCTGPGECLDFISGGTVQKSECDLQAGNFVGNVKCRGGVCSGNALITCSTNQECVDQGVGPTCVGGQQALNQPSPCPICEIEGPGNCQAFDNTLNFTLSDRHLGAAGLLAADDVKPDGDTLSSVCVWGFYLDGDPNATQNDCGLVSTTDSFRVRVFANDPATGRSPLPGAPLATSTATSERGIIPSTLIKTRLDVEVYGFQLVLTTPITGLTPGATYWIEVSNDVSATLATCNWFWVQQAQGSTAISFGGNEIGYGPTFEVPFENVFCTNFTFADSTIGAAVGTCCTCDGLCSLKTYVDCGNVNGVWDITANNCAGVTCPVGAPANDACAAAVPISAGSYVVNNQCATTDGLFIDSDFGGSQLDYDMWYTFIAGSACDLVVSECATGLRFDSMIAVYSNCAEGAPGGCDPTICPPCPLTPELNAAHLAGIGQDESCTGVAVGGPGIWIASEQILRPAVVGECFLLRIGSFPGGRGTANLDITCAPGGVSPPAVTANGAVKTRFISFDIPTANTAAVGETALRIKLTSLHHVLPLYTGGPSIPFTAFEGMSVYVGPPAGFVESSSSQIPFTAAFTQCAPYYHNWSTVGLLHVTGSAIVPSSTYTVEHLGPTCQGSEGSCSAFLPGTEIKTTRWGDVEIPYNPPSTTTQPDTADIGALVNKFRSAAGAPIKARALIAGSDSFGNITTLPVDVGFGHIAACIDAFRGAPYPFKMGKCTTGTGACTTNSDCTGANAPPCNLYCP